MLTPNPWVHIDAADASRNVALQRGVENEPMHGAAPRSAKGVLCSLVWRHSAWCRSCSACNPSRRSRLALLPRLRPRSGSHRHHHRRQPHLPRLSSHPHRQHHPRRQYRQPHPTSHPHRRLASRRQRLRPRLALRGRGFRRLRSASPQDALRAANRSRSTATRAKSCRDRISLTVDGDWAAGRLTSACAAEIVSSQRRQAR